MYIYDQIFKEVFYSAKYFDFYYGDSDVIGEQNTKIGVFDIETTGLDAGRGQVIMGALLNAVPGGLRVRQFFTEYEGEEEEVLIQYKKALDEMDVLVSYNGNGFDFPFLKRRLKRHYLDDSFGATLSLDMFYVLNSHSNFREIIPNLKQVTVEEYMGLKSLREDTIDGGKSVEIFFRYLEEKSDDLRDVMLLHNRDDVLQLSRLLWCFDKLDIHKIAFYTGFPVIYDEIRIGVEKIKVKTKRLEISGVCQGISGEYNIFRENFNVIFNPEDKYGSFEISMPLRYENKISYGVLGADEPKYVILKNNGETEYKNVNYFIKILLRDILSEI